MRKLLLATAAALGATMGMATYANAQIADDTDGQANVGAPLPTPGTVTVRLNGRFRFYAGIIDNGAAKSSVFSAPASSGSTSAGTVTTNTTNSGINKLANYGLVDYVRLYPGFDGVAANGLKYGASVEIRTDNGTGAGGGVNGSISGQSARRGELYIRRESGYIGTDRFGQIRVGATDQPTSLYLTGTFENFDDGGLDGDLPDFLPGAVATAFPFADQGNLYTTNKIVYLSPQFYGVDFGVSWEPDTGNVGAPSSGCGSSPVGTFAASGNGVASVGCDALISTSTNDYQRRRNTIDSLVRYRGTFGPVGIIGTASYTESGKIQDSGLAGTTSAAGVFTPNATNPKHVKVEDLSVGDFGLVLTYGGLSVGGNFQIGRYNVPAGGGFGGLVARGQPDANAAIIGASYAIGPVIFGAHYLRSFSMGDQVTATGVSTTGCRRCGVGLWRAAVRGRCGCWCYVHDGAGCDPVCLLHLGTPSPEWLQLPHWWSERRCRQHACRQQRCQGNGQHDGRAGLRRGHLLRLVMM